MKQKVPTAVAVVIIIVAVAAVVGVWIYLTRPEPVPATARGPGRMSLSEEERAQRQLENFDKMSEAEREKYRTGAPGQRAAWRRWAEARGVPIPEDEPPPIEVKKPGKPVTGAPPGE